jgi:hypothetical protein
MRRSLLKNLFLSSCVAALLVSCAPTSGYKLTGSGVITESQVRPIVNKNNSLLYKARIKLFNKRYSGLILLKQTDATTQHLTFVTEIGMKMFDFEIRDNTFKLIYVFEPLNKPKIIKLLESDMKLVLLQHLLNKEAKLYEKKNHKIYKIKDGYTYYYKLNPGTNTVKNSIVKGALFKKEKVDYLYNGSLDAQNIKLKHKGLVRLKIELNKLTTTSE